MIKDTVLNALNMIKTELTVVLSSTEIKKAFTNISTKSQDLPKDNNNSKPGIK
jgi:hypothetical protein